MEVDWFTCYKGKHEKKLSQLIREASSKKNQELHCFLFCYDNYHLQTTIATENSFTNKSLEVIGLFIGILPRMLCR
jgi:hypothetical protein